MVPQEIGRVLLNLLGNAFDAVHEHAATLATARMVAYRHTPLLHADSDRDDRTAAGRHGGDPGHRITGRASPPISCESDLRAVFHDEAHRHGDGTGLESEL